jgi:hypothetical protein
VPITKVYKFTAAAVMSTVALATVVTFTNADAVNSSPVAAVLPEIPSGDAPAPVVGTNDEAPEPLPSSVADDALAQAAAAASSSPSPTTSSRSTSRATTSAPTPAPHKPAPSPSPTKDNGSLGSVLGNLFN